MDPISPIRQPLNSFEALKAAGGFTSPSTSPEAFTQATSPPSSESFWDQLLSAGSGLISGIGGMLSGMGSTFLDGISSVGSGLVDLFSGNFGQGFSSIGSGLLSSFVRMPANAILMGGGSLISAIQTAVGIETPGRGLREDEMREVRSVFGNSLDLDSIRVKEKNVGVFGLDEIFGFGSHAFTLGNTVYLPGDGSQGDLDLLIHELTHVWQYQNGGTDYLSSALWAQRFGDGYDFQAGVDIGLLWSELNPEQQADLIRFGYLAARGAIFDRPNSWRPEDQASFLNALEALRQGLGAP